MRRAVLMVPFACERRMHERPHLAAWRRVVSGRDVDAAGARSVSHHGDSRRDHGNHLRWLARVVRRPAGLEARGARIAGSSVGYRWFRWPRHADLPRAPAFAARTWRNHHGHTATHRGRGRLVAVRPAPR